MAIVGTTAKGRVGWKAAKAAARRPGALAAASKLAMPAAKLGLKAGRPLLRRSVRRRVDLDGGARTLGRVLAVYAPRTAYELGLATPPRPKRSAPRVAAGVVVGAGAMYLLEPRHGAEHRARAAQLIGQAS